MSDTPRTDLVDEPFQRVFREMRSLERELAAEKERSARLEKALRAIANDDDEEFVTPVQIIRATAREALGDSNG